MVAHAGHTSLPSASSNRTGSSGGRIDSLSVIVSSSIPRTALPNLIRHLLHRRIRVSWIRHVRQHQLFIRGVQNVVRLRLNQIRISTVFAAASRISHRNHLTRFDSFLTIGRTNASQAYHCRTTTTLANCLLRILKVEVLLLERVYRDRDRDRDTTNQILPTTFVFQLNDHLQRRSQPQHHANLSSTTSFPPALATTSPPRTSAPTARHAGWRPVDVRHPYLQPPTTD